MHEGRNHSSLLGQRFLGTARTRPLYALLDQGDHPGMVRHGDGRSVEGELYEVELRLLAVLDEIEESPHYFRLEPVEIEGHTAPVFAYFYQGKPDDAPLLVGRWSNRR